MPKELQTLPRQQDLLLTHNLFVTIAHFFQEGACPHALASRSTHVSKPEPPGAQAPRKLLNSLMGTGGAEPKPLPDYESGVLPLHYVPKVTYLNYPA